MIGIRFRDLARELGRDETGTTLVEFAFVAPILCMMLLGLFDFGFQIYAQSLLQGAVQDAARGSTLEKGVTTTSSLDQRVAKQVHNVVPGAQLTFARSNYATFSDIGKAEDYVDTNGNNTCDNGEAFEDVNGNNSWDRDRGRSGVGGARDAVLYTVTADYDRVFPLHGFMNLPPKISVTGATVLRNQPYAEQGRRDPVVGACT